MSAPPGPGAPGLGRMEDAPGGTGQRGPVWAGLASCGAARATLGWRAGAAGGRAVDAPSVAAMAEFPDAERAADWLIDALSTPGERLVGAIVPALEGTGPSEAEVALAAMMADGAAGEVLVSANLETPPQLAGWERVGPADGATVTRMRPPRVVPTAPPSGPGAPAVASTPPAPAPDPAAPPDEDAPTRLSTSQHPGAGPMPPSAPPVPPAEPPARAARPEEPGPGYVLSHTYRIERLIGRGGMGSVYLARHVDLGTVHAIKVISPEHAEDPHVVSLFRREAESLRSVRHEAVVAHEGAIRDEHGRLYLVMEYADGPSLAKVLRDGPLEPRAVDALARRVGEGLAAAHEKGIVHRDLSPDNIVLVDDDVSRAQIIDFGIARNLDPGSKTLIGSQFAGKYSYASPEQLGLFGGRVDRRSDLYSLGLVIAAALGRPLDLGRSPAEATSARERLPDLSAFEAPWDRRLARLLEPDPRDRPESYAELLAEETAAEDATRRGAGRPGEGARAGRGGLVAVLLLLAVAAGVGGWWLLEGRSGPDGATEIAQPQETGPATDAPRQAPPEPEPEPELEPEPEPEPQLPPPPSRAEIRDAIEAALSRARTGARASGAPLCPPLVPLLGPAEDGGPGFSVTFAGGPVPLAQMEALRGDLARLRGLSGVSFTAPAAPWPFCRALGLVAGASEAEAPELSLSHPSGLYRDGDPIGLSVSNRSGEARYLYLAWIDAEGTVYNLLPHRRAPHHRLEPGERLDFGRTGDGAVRVHDLKAAPPHGRNLIVVLSAPEPLFDGLREQAEPISLWERDLAPAIDRIEAAGGRVHARTRFLETAP